MFDQGVMPRLQILRLYLTYTVQKARKRGDFCIGLENLTSLEHIFVRYYCMDGAKRREAEAVKSKIRDAIDLHPNHPTLRFSSLGHMYRD